MAKPNPKSPCVFLDRDGTIIYDRNYLSTPAQVKLYVYAAQSINKLRKAGFKVIVITNQSGISRGKFTFKDLAQIHKRFLSLLKQQGAKIDGLYFCPHQDSDNCNCRKPKIAMVLQAAKDHNLDLKKSFVVGDNTRDYLTGINMGGQGILVKTGHGKIHAQKVKSQSLKPLAICATLKQAVNLIVKNNFV
jgi:histidinol-phosphate phosphatase family protein